MESRGKTWVGRVRSRNEDVFSIRPEFGFLAVADGMGGTSAGHVAARIAIDEVSSTLANISNSRSLQPEDLIEAVVLANSMVFDRGQTYSDFAGMGTTIVYCIVDELLATFCHVGDSRGYLFRKKVLQQVTKDHSLVQEKVERGEMTAEEARVAPMRNLVTRSVGPQQTVKPEITKVELQSGDCLMLCSDGISDFVPHPEIQEVMDAHSHNLRFLASMLVETADKHGSTDNITTVVAKI